MKTKVDITPDVTLLRKSGEVNYTIPKAISELVDNSIDELIPGKKLTIEVTVGQKAGEKFIKVVDNAAGMDAEKAKRAMVMAHSSKARGRIGEFGLGMKTACSNLGAHFEIISATEGSKTAVRLVYDEDEFISNGKWEIEIEDVPKPFDYGTQITITRPKVNLYAGTKNTLLEKFGKVFKHFVASGDAEILVNGDPVVPYVPDTLHEYDSSIDFEINGKRIRGWVSLLRTASPKGGYGFDLIRHNRVMIEHEKLGFQPQAGLARLVGELILDEFPVTNNKTDFRRDTKDWDEMVKRLNEEFLVDIKREARRIANPGAMKPKDEAEVQEFVKDVQEALKADDLQQDLDRRSLDAELSTDLTDEAIPFDAPAEGETNVSDRERQHSEDDGDDQKPRIDTRSPIEQHRLNRIKTQLRNIQIEHQIARLGRDSLYKIWDVEGVGVHKKLVVTTNQDHPVYTAFVEGDFLLWVRHNIVEAVAEFFTESTGKTEAMLLIKSDILKHIGKMRLEVLDQPTYPTDDDAVETIA